MKILKSFLIFFTLYLLKPVISAEIKFNPLLTYSVRYHKMKLFPNITGNFTVDQYREQQFVNGRFKINSEKRIDKAGLVAHRCDLEGINCEYFLAFDMLDFCFKLKQKNQLWSRWYGSFHPPIECPIINNVDYEIKNATMEADQALRLYPEALNYRWRLTQKFLSGNEVVGSYMGEVSIFGYRKRPKTNNNKKP